MDTVLDRFDLCWSLAAPDVEEWLAHWSRGCVLDGAAPAAALDGLSACDVLGPFGAWLQVEPYGRFVVRRCGASIEPALGVRLLGRRLGPDPALTALCEAVTDGRPRLLPAEAWPGAACEAGFSLCVLPMGGGPDDPTVGELLLGFGRSPA
eukprot:g1061.t1